jgi:predicted DsbA family dithiol-disulfide isomerase
VAHPRIRFTFDYVDPGSYLTHALLRRWRTEGEPVPEVEWIPLELRPLPEPPLDPEEAEWAAMTGAMEEAAEEMGIPFQSPTEVPRSRKAHEMALHAEERGCHGAVHHALFLAHFRDGLDLGRVDVLVRLAEAAGLDGAEVRTVLGVDRFLPRVLELRTQALDRGIRGVPTLERGEDRLEGFTGVERLRRFATGRFVPGSQGEAHRNGRE